MERARVARGVLWDLDGTLVDSAGYHWLAWRDTLAAEGRAVGPEDFANAFGMRNDDVWRCHACLSIPTDARYGSLNLAQAVQLIAYEWRMALGGFGVAPRTPPVQHADVPMVQGAVEHWGRVLVQLGYLDPAAPKKLLPRLQQLLNRAQLTREEVHILRGIARSIEQRR